MSFKAFDDSGKELTLVTANVICPNAYVDDARKIASEYMKKVKVDTGSWEEEFMLPTPLSKDGNNPPTHYLCSMTTYDREAEDMVSFIAKNSFSWCAKNKVSEHPKAKDCFCLVVGELNNFLTKMDLRIIK